MRPPCGLRSGFESAADPPRCILLARGRTPTLADSSGAFQTYGFIVISLGFSRCTLYVASGGTRGFSGASFVFNQYVFYVDRGMEGFGHFAGYVGVPGWSFRVTVLLFVTSKVGVYAFTSEFIVVFFLFARQLVPTVGPKGLWCASW